MTATDPELRAAAARLVADWPPLTTEQLDLLRRTYGRAPLDPAAAAQPDAA